MVGKLAAGVFATARSGPDLIGAGTAIIKVIKFEFMIAFEYVSPFDIAVEDRLIVFISRSCQLAAFASSHLFG